MAQVGIVMGSDSDMPVMAKAADILEQLGITYEMHIISAHREPQEFFDYANSAEEKGGGIAQGQMVLQLPDDESLRNQMIQYLKDRKLEVQELSSMKEFEEALN